LWVRPEPLKGSGRPVPLVVLGFNPVPFSGTGRIPHPPPSLRRSFSEDELRFAKIYSN